MEPATSWFLVRFVNHCATTGTPGHCLFKLLTWLHLITQPPCSTTSPHLSCPKQREEIGPVVLSWLGLDPHSLADVQDGAWIPSSNPPGQEPGQGAGTLGEEVPVTLPPPPSQFCSEDRGRGLFQAVLAARPAFVVGGVYVNAQMFM